ncbi:MAG: urease accessory protein UreD [Curvibacter sp.]|jgi:urease accessory protein|nr:urease accessory protein UreD [Curvibacter sp.]
MTWHASLQLDYSRHEARSVAHYVHEGPLRILQSLYPEGDAICHNVIVHPPGGLVGGDTLYIRLTVGAGAHGLVTTPGATRFYRSTGETARQLLQARLAERARLEWLPLEALAYNACLAQNRAVFELAPGAELLGWDVTALGLPAAKQPYLSGSFAQHLEVPGVWLEQGRIDAKDARLMDGPLGLAGRRCLGTLFFVAGTPIERTRREAALECVRELIDTHALRDTAGATSPHPQVIVVRVLAPLVEPAMGLLRQLRAAWRQQLWQLEPVSPRIWAM